MVVLVCLYCKLIFSYKDYHQHFMTESPIKPACSACSCKTQTKLQLFIYGSCESDQYYHPGKQSESKRPICLSEIQNFQIEPQDQEGQGQTKIIRNPLFRAQIFKIACGALHTIVLTGEGQVYTFGCNDEGALGRQGIEKIPQKVDLPDSIDLISAGDNHSVFANSIVGSVYFSGNYKYMRGESIGTRTSTPTRYDVGQLDSRMKNVPITKVVSGSNHSAILVGGRIYIRGEPQAHTVGRRINQRHKVKNSMTFDSVGLSHVQQLWCGGYHSFAKVKKANKWHYYAWGLNKHGQLGLRNYQESPYPKQIKKLEGMNIVDVASGTNFTVLLTEEGELFGCGQNDDGQLGLGEHYEYQDSEVHELSNDIEKKLALDENQKNKVPEKEESQKQQLKSQKVQEKKEENPQGQSQKLVPEVKQPQVSQLKVEVPQKMEPQQAQVKKETIADIGSPINVVRKLQEQNIYIKSFKNIKIDEKLNHITAGSQFCFGWNNQSLYSWGFGSNFVLLNGREEDEFTPFKVKSKILNEHTIYDLAAGAQHVAYLSYPTNQHRPQPKLSQAALKQSQQARQKLSRRKKA